MPIRRITKKNLAYCHLLIAVVAMFVLAFTFVSAAQAHKVYLYAWVEGDTVYTESYFGSKNKVRGGQIVVYNMSGKKLLEGRTNEKGEFAFKAPQKADIRIVVEAGMGHRNEIILKAKEFLDGMVEPSESTGMEEKQKAALSSKPAEAKQIRTIVEQALDSRLKPIIRELAMTRKERGPGMTEIIGGIGYIVGLMGLIMYFKSRKKG